VGVILCQIILDLLHHLQKIFKTNLFDISLLLFNSPFLGLRPFLIFLGLLLLLSDLNKEHLSLLRVSLETLHDRFKVLDIDAARLILVK